MPNSADHIRQGAADAAKTLPLNANAPLRLDRLAGVFMMTRGYADLFAVGLQDSESEGARHHLLRIAEGDLGFGLPEAPDAAVIVVGGLDAEISVLTAADLVALTQSGNGDRVDHFIQGLSEAVFGHAPAWPDHPVEPGEKPTCDEGALLYAGRNVSWLKPLAGAFAVEADRFEARPTPIVEMPLVGAFHARATCSAQAEILATAQLTYDELHPALHRFLWHVAANLGHVLRAAETAAAAHLLARQRIEDGAMTQAVIDIAGVVLPEIHRRYAARPDQSLIPVFSAVARAIGCTPVAAPVGGEEITIQHLARLSGIGLRRVLLRDDWWRLESGALIGRRNGDGRQIGLIPNGARGYRLIDGMTSSEQRVTAEVAAGIAPDAVMLYPPLPNTATGVTGLFAFALRGSGGDFRAVIWMGLIASLLGTAIPMATGFLFDWVVPTAELGELAAVVAGLILAAIGAASVELVKTVAFVRAESRMEGLLQPAVMQRLLALPVGFFRNYGIGDLTDRVLAVQRLRQLIAGTTVVSLLSVGFSMVSVAVILWYSPRLALLSAALVLVAAVVTALLGLGQLRAERRATDLGGAEDGLVLQLIQGIGKLRVSASEARLFGRWASLFARRKAAMMSAQRYVNLRATFYGAYPLLASALVFRLAVGPLAAPGAPSDTLALGTFLTVSVAFGQLLAAMMAGAAALASAVGAVPLFERLRPILAALPEERSGKVDPGPLTGEIEFSHVTFRYGPDLPTVIDDLSLKTEPGQFIAVVGASGSGKSTLLRLLLGFETPETGDILYQGQSIAGLDAGALRRRIGVVLQNARIQSGTIFENITAGLPYALDDAWEAARMAGIAAEIEAMPMGMHTLLIEGAVALSGGQAQRLMIARALIGKPQVLIFDEATSALDSASQATVIASLNRLHVTRLVIAHRLTTIREADRIFVMERGRLVESGDFDSLMARHGAFYALAQRQLL